MGFMEEAVCVEDCSTFSTVPLLERKEYHLIDYDELPKYMKHNEFILRYYRPEMPWKQTILSIFCVHNETINVWTHLIGFFIFLALTVGASLVVPSHHVSSHLSPEKLIHQEFPTFLSSSVPNKTHQTNASSLSSDCNLPQPTYVTFLPANFSRTNLSAAVLTEQVEAHPSRAKWPFLAFLFGAMLCLLSSSTCHLLSCHSEHSSYVLLRLDYVGITTLIVTSFYPTVYYPFLCLPFIRNLYIVSITIFGIATILVSLVPFFETPEFRVARAGLFACMGISGLVPIAHSLVMHGDKPEAVITAAYETVMLCYYGLGVLVYAARIPERWLPGKFDLAGHSHQLFHVLVIAGAYTHYLAVLVYIQWRDMEGC